MSSGERYSNDLYKDERSVDNTWIGYIGLAYPSDYGYAADINICKNVLQRYELDDCVTVNWLTDVFTVDKLYWLISRDSGTSDLSWRVRNGFAGSSYINDKLEVVPTLYLITALIKFN